MEQIADRRMLNTILIEASKMAPEERQTSIRRCVAEGRHDPDKLPFCIDPSSQQLVRYCDRCWSVIDPHGLTWSWAPEQYEDTGTERP
jgi:hypothetical protein